MSLQVGFNNNFIYKNSGYGLGASGQVVMPPASDNKSWEKDSEVENAQNDKLMKKIGAVECMTCRNRKYVDGSDDAGVSFKTPTHVSPENSMTAVASHEQEHVSMEGAKARSEGREIVSQSVRIYTDVCPECGRVYASGGKTITITKADNKKSMESHFGKYIDKRL